MAVALGFLGPPHLVTSLLTNHKLEWVLGAYSDNLALQWNVDDDCDAEDAARALSATADSWTDGSMVKDDVFLVLCCWSWDVFQTLF